MVRIVEADAEIYPLEKKKKIFVPILRDAAGHVTRRKI